ncbi:MAG: hypothetical protein KKB30_03965 [Proteobacteria bacterium]|nr:hypothetical protein [Pseudomonadota bacterium]MBU1717006.1 hypothetical protein [Pseudomonadota bacterium]
METRHEDSDGSNIFWPGYVDATTNLVLNLLFLLTIMIVAVFMFALELGRTTQDGTTQPVVVVSQPGAESEVAATTEPVAENMALHHEIARLELMIEKLTASQDEAESAVEETNDPVAENMALQHEIERLNLTIEQLAASKQETEVATKESTDPVAENMALKLEIERLNMMLAQRESLKAPSGGLVKSVEATSIVPTPLKGLDKTIAGGFEITVRFMDEAVAFTPAEHDQLLETLQPLAESEETTIQVEVPPGFSEAKRLGFYRAMAVRNLLIEMQMPTEKINVSVVEGNNNANASLVKVRSR